MSIYGFEGPWDGFDRLRRELMGLVDRPRAGAPAPSAAGVFPPINVYATAEGYVLTAEVPGLDREALEVTVEGDQVTLRGERRDERPEGSVHRRERQVGRFARTLALPVPVDPEKTEAVYREGVLLVRIPKAPEHQSRKIHVSMEDSK